MSYRRPPVHEVIVSLILVDAVDVSQLETLPEALANRFPTVERQEQLTMGMSIGPAGHQIMEPKRKSDGWLFKDRQERPTRVISAGSKQLSIHTVRPGSWPTGEYAGWQVISEQTLELIQLLGRFYADTPVERAGLRYLNRVAIPVQSEFSDWFNVGFNAPPFLLDPYAINLRETWGRIENANDLSATVGLAAIEIPEPTLRDAHAGFLLDIEVFNLWKPKAPTFAQLPYWYRRAHDVEGDIFEWSITDNLRNRFEVIRQ